MAASLGHLRWRNAPIYKLEVGKWRSPASHDTLTTVHYPVVWRIAGAIFKSSAIVPNVVITVWIGCTLPALYKPLVSSTRVVWY